MLTGASCHWLTAALAEIANRRLSTHEKIVLFVLVHHGWSARECFLAYATIMRETSLSRRSVERAMSSLVRKGLVERVVQFKASGEQKENRYRLKLGGGASIGRPGGRQPDAQNRISERFLISGTDSLLEISETSLPPTRPARAPLRVVGGREARAQFPESWIGEARAAFPKAHSPARALATLAKLGFSEEQGIRYLRRAARARDLPELDHRAIAVWCSPSRAQPWITERPHVASAKPRERRASEPAQPLPCAEIARRGVPAFLRRGGATARSRPGGP